MMASGAGDNKQMEKSSLNKPAFMTRMLELMRAQCTAEQWGDWLTMPVELAAAGGDKELTEELMRAGARGDPISKAIRAGQYDVVKHLRPEPKQHHLRLAVEHDNEAMVYLLLELGADPEPEARWGYGDLFFTPLHLAAKAGQAGIVGLLLDAGARADRPACKDETTWDQMCDDQYNVVKTECALHMVAREGYVDVIKAITQRKPSTVSSVAESTGYTALHYAAKYWQLGAIDALVEAGADLNAEGGAGIGTALHIAAESPEGEPTLLALLRHGANVDPATPNANSTPLFSAVKAGNVRAASILVSAGADVRESLFFASAEPSSDEMLLALLGRGADVNTKQASDGNTPLHLAAMAGDPWIVDILLKAGGDETAVNDRGETPLDVVGRQTGYFLLLDHHHLVRPLLENAARDRADRAWARRGFFVLCRTFPSRVRLGLGASADRGIEGNSSNTKSTGEGPTNNQNSSKRPKMLQQAGGEEQHFPAAMGRLLGLGADTIFRTIVEFL